MIILNLMHKVFPNVYFKRENKAGLNDDMQDKISNWLIAGGIGILGIIFYFIKTNLSGLIKLG